VTDAFDPITELRNHGLCGNNVPAATAQILGTLTRPQVDVFVQVKQRIDTFRQGARPSEAEDTRLARAMTQATGWDRPSMAAVGAEVEGMESACACLCTGSGGGGGA
jgi:hypothetical protein